MDIFSSFNNQLDDLLHRICIKLELPKNKFDLAEQRYYSVGEWLSGDGSSLRNYSPTIYSQGSLRIGTTVKPRKREEYDLDLVCELKGKWQEEDPLRTLRLVFERLNSHDTYSDMIELKNRCVRLNYANDFHLDILPGFPTSLSSKDSCIKVPDRKAEDWKDSNPKGYAEWFEQRVRHRTYIEKMSQIEPIPSPGLPEYKPPLKRVVQLMKRNRDISFDQDDSHAPISIVLTTLAALNYQGTVSVADTISSVLSGIVYQIPHNGRLKVLNPTNPAEDLSERWDNDSVAYIAFKEWLYEFQNAWGKISELRGLPEVVSGLKELFGETVDSAVREQAEFIEKNRSSNNLAILNTTGGLTSSLLTGSTTAVRKNTFYGK